MKKNSIQIVLTRNQSVQETEPYCENCTITDTGVCMVSTNVKYEKQKITNLLSIYQSQQKKKRPQNPHTFHSVVCKKMQKYLTS